jgi:elongation factor Ts
MAEISAADVAKLRKMTGSGMMDCKEALGQSGGNFEEAIEFLRKRGQKVASKRGDREATEGCVLAAVTADNTRAVIVALNCETDFVAKNEEYIGFTQSILNIAIEKAPASLEALLGLQLKSLTISDGIIEKIGTIGEKLELSCYEQITAEQVCAYIHPGNKLATIVGFNQKLTDIQVGRDVAMQIAAMSPISIDKADCPTDIIEKEIEIGKDQARQEGKPEAMLEKIAMGKLQKFYNENTLLNQEFVKDNTMTIRQYLTKIDKDLTVTAFRRYTLNA